MGSHTVPYRDLVDIDSLVFNELILRLVVGWVLGEFRVSATLACAIDSKKLGTP